MVRMFKKVMGLLTVEKKIDMILALTLVCIIWFRLGTYILMCITHPNLDIVARWFIGLFCASGMIAAMIFFGFGTLFESQGEGSVTREEYLHIMKYCSGGIVAIIGVMTPIYLANIQNMTILGYTSIPCIIAVLALYLIYRIKHNEVVD